MYIFSYPSVLTYVLGAKKNRLIETVLLSNHNKNICFGRKIRKLNFGYAFLTKKLDYLQILHKQCILITSTCLKLCNVEHVVFSVLLLTSVIIILYLHLIMLILSLFTL